MKNIFYLLLIISLSSCSFYKATGQSPYQYTSVSEQIIVDNQFYNEPITYFNYVPTFTFASYYSYNYWRPIVRFHYWMYPTVNYWGWNSWNGWNYYNNWNYTYYPYYLNNWAYYNNLYHPYTYNPYFIHPNQGFSNFNPGCNSPFYVFADRYRIRQVLVNLFINSIKYGNEFGTTTAAYYDMDENILI